MAEPSTDTFSSDSGPVPFVDDMPREGSSMPYFPTKDTQKNPANIASLIGDGDAARRNIIAGETKLIEKQIGFEGAQQRQQDMRDNRYRERMERMVSAEGTTADDLKPWNAEQELAEHKTDLWSQFGSPGFIISMLASAFTAQPMNTALTAGAAAMNAINQGDMNAYNKAFDVWKENTNLTLKRLGLEHERFADIDKLRTTDMAAWRTKVELLMRQFGDERKLMLLQNGMDPELDQAFEGQWKAEEGLANAQQALMQQHVLLNAVNADPRWKSGDPQQMMAAYTDAVKQIKSAEFAGRYGAAPSLSREQATAIDERATEIQEQAKKEGHEMPRSEAIARAAQEIRPSFAQPRSPATLAVSKYMQAHPDATSDDVVEFSKVYTGIISRARALGTRSAAIDVAVDEAIGASKQALTASKAVPRGNWVPINQISQLVREKKSSPEQQRFNIANAALVTAYAQTMSRTGVNSVMAQRRAMDILQTATGPAAYEAGVEQLMTEMRIVKEAVRTAQETGELSGNDPGADGAPAGGAAPGGTTSHGVTWSVQP